MLDSSQWIFSKYQIFVVFSTGLLKKFKFKIVHWHDQLGQVIRDEKSTNNICYNTFFLSLPLTFTLIWWNHEGVTHGNESHVKWWDPHDFSLNRNVGVRESAKKKGF